MNTLEIQEFRSHIADLNYKERKALKEAELYRMAYNMDDPLKVLLCLEKFDLLWY